LNSNNESVDFTNATVTVELPDDGVDAIIHENNGEYEVVATDVTGKQAVFNTDSFSNFVFIKDSITIGSGKILNGIAGALYKASINTDIDFDLSINLLPGTYNVGTNAERFNVDGLDIIGAVSAGKPATIITSDHTENGSTVTCALYGSTFRDASFKNIVFGGKEQGIRYSYAYGEVTFDNCVFDSEKRGFHTDKADSSTKVSFTDCTFIGKNSFAGGTDVSLAEYVFKDCVFEPNVGFYENSMRGAGEFIGCTFNDGVSLLTEFTDIDPSKDSVEERFGSINLRYYHFKHYIRTHTHSLHFKFDIILFSLFLR